MDRPLLNASSIRGILSKVHMLHPLCEANIGPIVGSSLINSLVKQLR